MQKKYSRKYFIIASHGWSASNWLAYVLSKHSQFCVSHSAANLIKEKLSNDIEGMINKFHVGYLNRQARPIEDAYLEIEKKADYNEKYIGSVHLYRLRDLPILKEKYGEFYNKYIVYNLVRHPVSLVLSGYGQFKELFKTDINELYWNLKKLQEDKEYVYELSYRYNLKLGEYENLAFICAARVLESLSLDIKAEGVINNIDRLTYKGIIKMEDITRKSSVLDDLIVNITDGKVQADNKYLQEVYNTGKINQHNRKKEITIGQSYVNLKTWQKEVLEYFLHKYSIVHYYSKIGYDFSFLKKD